MNLPVRLGTSSIRTLRLELATHRRSIRRYGVHPMRVAARLDERAVFVVGSPRSGTSFIAEAIGRVPGFADLGEVNLIKASVPGLVCLDAGSASLRVGRILRRAQRLGMVAGLRPVEQTPESTFLIEAIAGAFPGARFLHMVRDVRDVACSLIERGWLRDEAVHAGDARRRTSAHDDAGQPFGSHARFWVEPGRRDEFDEVSEARRAAWAWRRYTEAALAAGGVVPDGALLLARYERMTTDHESFASELGAFLDLDDAVQVDALRREVAQAHDRSRGRWQRELSPQQLADIELEAGSLMNDLGYEW